MTEAEIIARSRAEAANGRLIPLEDVVEWVESWGTPNELPPPSTKLSPEENQLA